MKQRAGSLFNIKVDYQDNGYFILICVSVNPVKKIIRNQRFERVACLVQKVQRFDFEIVFSTNLAIWQQMLEFSLSL